MNPAHLMVVLGTRPEAVKLAPLVLALRGEATFRTTLVATGQHRELLAETLAVFGLEPDVDLGLMSPGQGLAAFSGRLLQALDPLLEADPPALVIAQGDTSTVLAAALAAFWRRIPFAHVEAGLRSDHFAEPFPEEAHRVLASRLARLHFAPSAAAAQRLLAEGQPADSVHEVGNTVIDALLWAAARVAACPHGKAAAAAGRRLLLATVHRRESWLEPGAPSLVQVCQALRRLAARGDVQILLPVHPRPEVRAVVERELAAVDGVTLVAPLAYPALVAALKACTLVLTDSGGLQEEAPALGKPVLVLRRRTERPEAVACGAARLVGTEAAAIVDAAEALLDDAAALAAMAVPRFPYGRGDSAARIVGVLRAWTGGASAAGPSGPRAAGGAPGTGTR